MLGSVYTNRSKFELNKSCLKDQNMNSNSNSAVPKGLNKLGSDKGEEED